MATHATLTHLHNGAAPLQIIEPIVNELGERGLKRIYKHWGKAVQGKKTLICRECKEEIDVTDHRAVGVHMDVFTHPLRPSKMLRTVAFVHMSCVEGPVETAAPSVGDVRFDAHVNRGTGQAVLIVETLREQAEGITKANWTSSGAVEVTDTQATLTGNRDAFPPIEHMHARFVSPGVLEIYMREHDMIPPGLDEPVPVAMEPLMTLPEDEDDPFTEEWKSAAGKNGEIHVLVLTEVYRAFANKNPHSLMENSQLPEGSAFAGRMPFASL